MESDDPPLVSHDELGDGFGQYLLAILCYAREMGQLHPFIWWGESPVPSLNHPDASVRTTSTVHKRQLMQHALYPTRECVRPRNLLPVVTL